MSEQIETFEEAMEVITRMVATTEKDSEMAIAATATIGSLIQRGFSNLALNVLQTYKPGNYENEGVTK